MRRQSSITSFHCGLAANCFPPKIVNRFAVYVIARRLWQTTKSTRKCTACGKDISHLKAKVVTCGGVCEFETQKRRQSWKKCEWCGVEFRRKNKDRDALRFCCREHGWWSRGTGSFCYSEWKTCAGCGIPFQAKREGSYHCSTECAEHPKAPRLCECGRRLQPYVHRCDACRIEHDRARLQSAEYIANLRKSNRKVKATRRARYAGVVRVPTSIGDVIEAHGCNCHLCGIRCDTTTSHETNSATIDHIVPLALGGWHDLINLRVACRACNSIKGAKYSGQLMLTYTG